MDKIERLEKILNESFGIPEDKRPLCRLVGEDGNAFAIIGRVCHALKKAGLADKCDEYIDLATQSDYDNLLRVTMEYVREPYFEDEEYAKALDKIAEYK
jgi:hypothetical protein